MLADHLAKLDSWLASHLPVARGLLRPGLDQAGLDAFHAALGGRRSAALDELLAWHDGQQLAKPATPIVGADEGLFELLPADAIAAEWRTLGTKLDKGGFDGPTFVARHAWSRGWLPFAKMKTALLVVDLDGAFGSAGAAGQVLRVTLSDGGRMIVAPSLEAYLATLVLALETGAIAAVKGKLKDKRWPSIPLPDAKQYPIRKRIERDARAVATPAAEALLKIVSQRMSADEITAAIAAGASLTARDRNGCTSLHLAAQAASGNAAQALLAAGAEVDARDHTGRTPLAYAVEHARSAVAVEIARVLVAAGADPDAADDSASTPRTRAAARWDVTTRDAVGAALAR